MGSLDIGYIQEWNYELIWLPQVVTDKDAVAEKKRIG
tara:strand:- start:293 stop:403 length:111 start_codon:yes stop_codon:yes gene_type:complete